MAEVGVLWKVGRRQEKPKVKGLVSDIKDFTLSDIMRRTV